MGQLREAIAQIPLCPWRNGQRSPAHCPGKFPSGSEPLEHKAVWGTQGSADGGMAPEDEMAFPESLGQGSHVFATCNEWHQQSTLSCLQLCKNGLGWTSQKHTSQCAKEQGSESQRHSHGWGWCPTARGKNVQTCCHNLVPDFLSDCITHAFGLFRVWVHQLLRAFIPPSGHLHRPSALSALSWAFTQPPWRHD